MTESQKPLGMSDFFALEAGEYLERLDGMLATGDSPSADEIVRLARALRGSALMANQPAIARAAAGLEVLARAVREARRAWFRSQYSYDFKVAADGSFSVPEVLPGTYRLFINVAQGYLGSGPDSNPSGPGDHRVASTAMKVLVPEGDTPAPLDLGDVVLVAD